MMKRGELRTEILRILQEEGALTASALSGRTGVTPQMVGGALKTLKFNGEVIKTEGDVHGGFVWKAVYKKKEEEEI